jgi:hypothetical protein
MILTGETEELGEKSIRVTLDTRIPHGLSRERTRASVVLLAVKK